MLQHDDGGFKYWGSDDFSDKYLSIDVAYLYKLCKQYGYSFPVDTQKLTVYIFSNMPIDFCYEEKMKFKYSESTLFFLYGLNNFRKLDECEMSHLLQIFNYKDSLCLSARLRLLALLYKNSYRKKALSELHEICDKITVKENIAYFEESKMWNSIPFERAFYNSKNIIVTELIKLLLEMEPDNNLIPKLVRYLISEMNQDGRWSNTYETSAILEAIAFYCKKHEADTSAYKLSISANGKSYFSSSSEVDIRKPVSIHIPISDLNVGKNDICILKDNKNYLYYTIKYSYNLSKSPKPVYNRGLAINRKIYRYNDSVPLAVYNENPPDTLRLSSGEVYKIELEYSSVSRFYDVVIDDPVPAGMEIINTTFANVSSNYSNKNQYGYYTWSDDPYTHKEIQDDRMIVSIRNVNAGKFRYSYLVRSVTKGTFFWPCASIFPMYNTELVGTTSEGFVRIK